MDINDAIAVFCNHFWRNHYKESCQEDNTSDYVDNTNVLQEKDERISDLKTQIDDYKKQIEQLHTIILATQKDNQLLIEQKAKRGWKFWE